MNDPRNPPQGAPSPEPNAAAPSPGTDETARPSGPSGGTPDSAPVDPVAVHAKIVEQIQTCYDPEIPVNIYELGLIYGIDVQPDGNVHIRMTLTSPMCPAAGSLPGEVEQKARTVPGVREVKLELVWEPPWDMSKMSEAARVALNMFY